MSCWSRLANVVRRSRVDDELDDELRFHIEARVDELVRRGVPRREAEASVRLRFGNALRLREQSRDVKVATWIESLMQDVRFGLRLLRRDAMVAGTAVVSLALAIGACTAAFSLIDALILRPLPVYEPERLVYLSYESGQTESPEHEAFDYPMFERLRGAARAQADLIGISFQQLRRAGFADANGDEEDVRVQWVSGDTFSVLGVTPALGRLLTPADDRVPGERQVAVLSHAFWMRRFGGDPTVVGRAFTFDERRLEIVGIAEPRFTGTNPGRLIDLWLPTMMWNADAFKDVGWSWLTIVGRVKPGVQPEQARAALHTVFRQTRHERVKLEWPSFTSDADRARVMRYVNRPLHVRSAATGISDVRMRFERPLWILAVVVLLVLLIASSNVTNLLIARAAAREREMSLRLSIGASRGRVIQQVLVESALVAMAATALGVLIAMLVGPLVVRMLAPSADPAYLELRLDWRLLAFVSGLGLLTTLLFGLAPAVRASSVSPMGALKMGAGGRVTARLTLRPLMAAQIGFSLTVLFLGALLLMSFGKLVRVDLGFAKRGLLNVAIDAPAIREDTARQRAVGLRVIDRVRQLPGVQDAAMADWPLFHGILWTMSVRLPGRESDHREIHGLPVSPRYFETMKMRVLEGRPFGAHDMTAPEDAHGPAVVNEAFARHYFGTIHVVGRTFERLRAEGAVRHDIVGVVNDAKYRSVRDAAPPTVYVPMRRLGPLHVRAAEDAGADLTTLAAMLRREIPREAPGTRVLDVMPLSTAIDDTLLVERLLALLSGFFGAVGLLLAAVGVYGVLSYAVVQRTREIGIRVALGAQPLGVVRHVVGHIVWVMAVGIAAGLAGGVFLSRFVTAMLYDVRPLDTWTLALPVAGLMMTAVLAAVPPARRAARVDPVVALRCD